MKRPIILVFILFFISFFFNASGQQKVIPPPESDRTSSTSNRDFIKYLARVEVGLAYGQYTLKHPIGEFILSGLAIPMDVQVGIGILPKTYIHGAFGVTIMDRPTYTLDAVDYTYEGTLGMFDVGIGFTVYPLPQKIYASATIYGTTTALFADEDVFNSEIGVAFNLKGGIDFMLGSVFSVGASAFLYYAGMKDQPDDDGYKAQINNFVIGVCLTTTLGNL
jgi:hypothetical protein